MTLLKKIIYKFLKKIRPCVFYHNGLGWIRIFGFGIYWKNSEKQSLLFSERNKFKRSIVYKKWYISFLPFF